MKKICAPLFLFFIIGACNKDSFETKPTLKLESISSKVVPKDSDLIVNFSFTDKEGDISDTLFVLRQRHNIRGPQISRATPYRVPEFPNETSGEISLRLDYTNGLTLNLSALRIPGSVPTRNEPDTMTLRFVLKDKAGNKSDTVSASVVVER